jgi:arylsulfatase A-like enzyme
MERRPRAPVLRSIAFLAIAVSASSVKEIHLFHLEQLAILLDQSVLRFNRIFTSAAMSRSSSVAMTGRRPTNSGIRPNLSRSSGSLWL